MIRLFTLIGVYVFLPTAAFNGTTSLLLQQGKNAPDAVLITRKAVTSTEKKEQSATLVLHQLKIITLQSRIQPFCNQMRL